MPTVVIVGAQWGDEGKGKIVDFCTEYADVVVRYAGGPNAGHTLVVGDDKLIVRAELPGIDPDRDVDVDIRDHSLRIRAERRQEERKEVRGGYRSEFHYGTFTRTIPLAAAASEKDVKASYRNGILEVRVPIDQTEAQAKKIAIEHT